jgi:hypothetical protein
VKQRPLSRESNRIKSFVKDYALHDPQSAFSIIDNREFGNLDMRSIQSQRSATWCICPTILVLNKDDHHRRESS